MMVTTTPLASTAQAAQAFEAHALSQLLAPMFDTVDTGDGPFGGGEAEKAWRPMLTDAIAKHIAAHGGIGLAAPVLAQMLQMQELAQQPKSTQSPRPTQEQP
jgi:Rod binding domain-containing protein